MGLVVFAGQGTLDPGNQGWAWVTAYYTWQIGKDFLAVVGIWRLIYEKYPEYEILFKWCRLFAIIRVCFQIPIIIFGIDQNGEFIVNILWLIATVALITLIATQIRKKWRR